jgi:hypothetical protein
LAGLALLVLALLVLGCTSTPAGPTTLPASQAAPPATMSAAPSPAETMAPSAAPSVPEFPPAACCRGRDIDAGRYRLPRWLGLPATLDVPAGWRVQNEAPAKLFVIGRGENSQGNPSQLILIVDATESGSPGEVVDAIRGVPQLEELRAPTDVEVAGLPGRQVDLAALPNPEFTARPDEDIPAGVQVLPIIERYFAEGFAWTTSSPEARLRLIALTLEGRTMLVYLEAPPGDFEALVTDALAILESLEPAAP